MKGIILVFLSVFLFDGYSAVPPPRPLVYGHLGDTNGDGVIDTEDLALIQRSAVTVQTPNNIQTVADINGDGIISTTDGTLLSAYISSRNTNGWMIVPVEADPADLTGDARWTIVDWVQAGRYAAGLDPSPVRDLTKDARWTIVDWVQAGRYSAGLQTPPAPTFPPPVINNGVRLEYFGTAGIHGGVRVSVRLGSPESLQTIWRYQVALSLQNRATGERVSVTMPVYKGRGDTGREVTVGECGNGCYDFFATLPVMETGDYYPIALIAIGDDGVTIPESPFVASAIGSIVSVVGHHSADLNRDGKINHEEWRFLVSLYVAGSYHTDDSVVGGYAGGQGSLVGPFHMSDTTMSWSISLEGVYDVRDMYWEWCFATGQAPISLYSLL